MEAAQNAARVFLIGRDMELEEYKKLVRQAVRRVANSSITNAAIFGQHMELELERIEDPHGVGTILGIDGTLVIYKKTNYRCWVRIEYDNNVHDVGSHACVLQDAEKKTGKQSNRSLRVLREGWHALTKSEVDCG